MLEGRGNTENIVCPLHRWTYDLKGELLGAPLFPETPCVKLHSTPLINWNGLLFAGPRDPRKDLARITTMADWDFSGYVLDSVSVDEYDMQLEDLRRDLPRGLPRQLRTTPAWATSPIARTSPSTTARNTRSRSSPPRPAWSARHAGLPANGTRPA